MLMRLVPLLACCLAACTGPSASPAPAAPPLVEVEEPERPPTMVNEPAPIATTPKPQVLEACIADLEESPSLPPGADRDLYLEALRSEEGGDVETSRKLLLELTQSHPKSAYLPLAYLRFAAQFTAEAAERPHIEKVADQFLTEVLKYPPPQNTVYAVALLRRGRLAQELEQHRDALGHFVKLMMLEASHPGLPCLEPLLDEGRRRLVTCYAWVGEPGKAFAFFRRFTKDGAKVIDMLFSLAEILIEIGKQPEAVAVLGSISKRSRGPEDCARIRAVAGRIDGADARRKLGAIQGSCR